MSIEASFPVLVLFAASQIHSHLPIIAWKHMKDFDTAAEGNCDPVEEELSNIGFCIDDQDREGEKFGSLSPGFYVWEGSIDYTKEGTEYGGAPYEYDTQWNCKEVRKCTSEDFVNIAPDYLTGV